jgi:hypothetical protein
MRDLSGFRRIPLAIALLIAGGAAVNLRAQSVLGDPRDAHKVFASTCSACHKSPQGLAKSGQVAGFLRQHYTTGPEMSAAMAAYLVSVGNAPAPKKGQVTAAVTPEGPAAAAKTKSKQLSAVQPGLEGAPPVASKQTLRGKQRQLQPAATEPVPAPSEPGATEEQRQAAASPAAAPAQSATPAAAPAGPPPMVLDIPMPELPEGPPADLAQSAFSSSPVP